MRRAAERLHVAQPALTRQIADLESEIGCKLFERLPRGIRLSAAGAVMLNEANRILGEVDAAIVRAQRASRGESGTLRIGFIESASWLGAFPNAIQTFRSQLSEVTLQLRPMHSVDQLDSILSDELDGGFAYSFDRLPRQCSSLHLRSDKVLLAVPRRYGWRTRKRLRLRELSDEPFISIRRASAPQYLDKLWQAVASGGLSPKVVQEAGDETTMLSLVSSGIGLGFVNSANEGRKPQFVDFVPIENLKLALPLHFVWKSSNNSPTLKQFIAIARRLVEKN